MYTHLHWGNPNCTQEESKLQWVFPLVPRPHPSSACDGGTQLQKIYEQSLNTLDPLNSNTCKSVL